MKNEIRKRCTKRNQKFNEARCECEETRHPEGKEHTPRDDDDRRTPEDRDRDEPERREPREGDRDEPERREPREGDRDEPESKPKCDAEMKNEIRKR